jgi:hypothetical protein
MPAYRRLTLALVTLAALIAAACSSGTVAQPDPTPAPFPTRPANPEPSVVIESSPVAGLTGPLTREDVLAVIGEIAITVEQLEPQAIDDSEAPVPVSAISSWVILIFQSPGPGPAIVFSVMTLVSAQDARTVFDEVRRGLGAQAVTVGLGDNSVAIEPNSAGVGSLLTFVSGDRVISMTATLSPSGLTLTDLSGLTSLGRTAADRLAP